MRKSYKGEVVIDKATLMHLGGIYADIYVKLSEAMNAPGFNENSQSGTMLKDLAESYAAKSNTTLNQATEKRPGRPAGKPLKLVQKIGRPRKAGREWEDLVYELVENKRIIQEVFKDTNGNAAAALREVFDERVLPMFKTNAIDTRKNHFGRLENAYKRAKARKTVKVANSDQS
jgi:hypothetical protein